jgi:hypothetical protein
MDAVNTLIKALEAGSYDAAPSSLVQGAALQIEDLSPKLENVTFSDEHVKLQKMFKSESCKSTTAQFDRQLSYGQFGGSAQLEGAVGGERTSDFVRVTVPMSYYSHIRQVTIASTMVATVDGKKSDDRAASDAAKTISGDIEFDSFLGMDSFSNNGVFDGHPVAVAELPNIHGLQLQIRQSDSQSIAKDMMFGEFGSNESVVLSGGGSALTQDKVEDAAVRSSLNFGQANKLCVDPVVASAYNKLAFNKERIVLAGSAQGATGATLSKQWVSGGTVDIEVSHFLRAKHGPAKALANTPGAPSGAAAAVAAVGAAIPTASYVYLITGVNENGEGSVSASVSHSVTLGDGVDITITHGSGTNRAFNVYRGSTAGAAKFIGRVKASNGTTTVFRDLGNRVGGFVTGVLVQDDVAEFGELAPYSRLKLAVTSLATPEAHFRFCTLKVFNPRKCVLIDNLKGTF